jgi:hypothetical protein
MENTNVLPQPLPGEDNAEYCYRAAQEMGSAWAMYSAVRDHYVNLCEGLIEFAKTNELTPEDRKGALKLANVILEKRAKVDVAFEFEKITETGSRTVN